jgi:methylglutaconyl-CoA hydratase
MNLVELTTPDPSVAVLSLNRPDKRNALCLELIQQITAAIADAQVDAARRVLIVRGEGPSFCAGLDLKEASEPGGAERSAQALCEMYQVICGTPLVTIAAARGAAMGGGAGLAIACDFLVVAEDFKLGFPEVHRGLVAALVTTILRRQVGDRTARELVLLGQTIDARHAVSLGLTNLIVSAQRLDEEARGLARQVCLGAPDAIVRSKRLLDQLNARPIHEELQRALQYHLEARSSHEAQEGMQAFVEKRSPRWGKRS